MSVIVGSEHLSRQGTKVVVAALAKNSETLGVEVVYTPEPGIYWALPLEEFEAEKPWTPSAARPSFTVALGKHTHFKGGEYEVVCRLRHPHSLVNLIAYKNTLDELWLRPESMFLEEVEWMDGVRRLRFLRSSR